MVPPRRAGLPAACLLFVLSMLTACGGGADTSSTQTETASSAEGDAIQALLAAPGTDAPAHLNLAVAPDLHVLAARASTPDLMLDTDSTP